MTKGTLLRKMRERYTYEGVNLCNAIITQATGAHIGKDYSDLTGKYTRDEALQILLKMQGRDNGTNGFAAQNARAEKDGFFFGGAVFPAISMGTTTNEYKWRYSTYKRTEQELIMSLTQLVFGYTHALGERLGLRYYGSFSFGVPLSFNVDFANVDALYTLIKGESAELRAFAGVWLGWESYYGGYYYNDETHNSGLDLGANAGLRLVLGQRHGVEVYGRFGFLSQTKEYSATSWEVSQPYLIGVRYTISF